jgi:hypothetical protein
MVSAMDWTEVNVTPAGDHVAFLATAVPVLIQGAEAWFFFWEPAEGKDSGPDEVLRLRILGADRDALFRELDRLRKAGTVTSWYEGSHGTRGGRYEGEAGGYGAAAWTAVYRDWQAFSELALRLAQLEARNALEKPRSFYWKRKAHLTANQLGLADVRLCLEQAQRYLTLECAADPRSARMIAEIDWYLYGDAPGSPR